MSDRLCFPTDGEPGYLASLRGRDNTETIDEYVEFVPKVVHRIRGRLTAG